MNNANLKKILIVAYYFPPVGGAGSQRPLKFAKYLVELGWSVSVLTKLEPDETRQFEPIDQGLTDELEELMDDVEIIRLPQAEKSQSGIDPYENWSVQAGSIAAEYVQENGIDVTLITMSPFSLVRVAEQIYEKSHTPIVLDLRDPWALDVWQKQKTYWHWSYQFKQMRKALTRAHGVILNTDGAKAAMLEALPELNSAKLAVITNGYDKSDFCFVDDVGQSVDESKDFEFLFTGSLLTEMYRSENTFIGRLKNFIKYTPEKADLSGRTLIHLLEAFRLLETAGVIFPWKISCIGAYTDADRQSAMESGYGSKVCFEGYLRHDEVVRRMMGADCLFLPLHNIPEGKETLIVPGKTYEYLASGRPILGCLPAGDARNFVDRTENGITCSPTSPHDISIALRKIVSRKESSRLQSSEDGWVEQFERRALTVKLDEFLHSLPSFNPKLD